MLRSPTMSPPAVRRTAILLSLALLAGGGTAAAQPLLFRVSSPAAPSDGVYDLESRRVSPAVHDEAVINGVQTSDGQFAVAVTGTGMIRVHHRPSGATTRIALDFRPVAAHPRQVALFGFTGASVLARLDAGGLTPLATPCALSLLGYGVAASLDGRIVYALCPGGELVRLDSATGHELGRAVLDGVAGGTFMVSADDTVVVAVRSAGGASEIARFDVATGTLLGARATVAPATIVPLPSRTRFVEQHCPGAATAACTRTIVDAATLVVRAPLPMSSIFHRLLATPDDRHIVVNDQGSFYFDSGVMHVDGLSGQVLAQAFVPYGSAIVVALPPVPLPPVLAAAQVAAGTVELGWSLEAASPLATGYVVEAGTAPGTTMVTLGAAAAALSVPGAPPGRYYVRVRAVNHNGSSPPSNEIVVDVP